ncbi:MAG: iron ABC transporter permease [Lachnospiraceae bacterium]|nr:iron ABC transporter permease [Lachnospiraceae bacterium]
MEAVTINGFHLLYMKKNKQSINQNRIQLNIERTEVSKLNEKRKSQTGRLTVPVILLLIWIGLYLGSAVFGFRFYSQQYGVDRSSHLFSMSSSFIEHSYNLFFHAGDTGSVEYVYYILIMVALTGAALAACGAVFQGTFKNVLAGPSTMGAMSGCSMGCMIYMLCFYEANAVAVTYVQQYQMELLILAGGFGGVLLILLVSMVVGRGKVSSSTMIIAGTVFSGVISNVMLLAQYWIIANDPSDPRVEDLKELMMGHFDNWPPLSTVIMMLIPILGCLIILMFVSGKLNVLSLGEDEATTMGLNVRRYRMLMIIIGTVLTSIVVAFCGRIGFIGFMVPLIMRRFVGPDLRKLLPVSILGGAILLTVIYDIARLTGFESTISMLTGPIGCCVMVVALFRKGGGRRAD